MGFCLVDEREARQSFAIAIAVSQAPLGELGTRSSASRPALCVRTRATHHREAGASGLSIPKRSLGTRSIMGFCLVDEREARQSFAIATVV
jgi:hypothetical protein